jgi:hypothetical protein
VFEADIQAAIDRQREIERKAAAWDKLREFADRSGWSTLVAQMDSFVHPAQKPGDH